MGSRTPLWRKYLRIRGSDVDADIDDELRFHLDMIESELRAEGMSPAEAHEVALASFGDPDEVKEWLRRHDRRRERRHARTAFGGSLRQDLRLAARMLTHQPGYAAVAVLTLALGIGSASAIFAVFDAALVRSLPYPHADRLMEVKQFEPYTGVGTIPFEVIPEFIDGVRPFSDGWLAFRSYQAVVRSGDAGEQTMILGITPGADTLLSIPLRMGRSFTPEDARPGSPDVVVLTAEYFERMGADPSLLGAMLYIDRRPATIVGVLAESVKLPQYGDFPAFWTPLRSDFTVGGETRQLATELWIRLAEDVDRDAANARVAALGQGFFERDLLTERSVVNMRQVGVLRMAPDGEQALWALVATGLTILLITVVNGVNLQLVRASARIRELQVRLTLGASRARLLRQLLVEGALLGMVGGLVAVAFAWVALASVQGILPSILTWSSPFPFVVEQRTLVVTFVTALLVGSMLGLLPGLSVVRPGAVIPTLRRRTDDRRAARTRFGLVVAQVALSMTLLVSAGLFVRSLARLWSVHPGFEAEQLIGVRVEFATDRYPEPADRVDLLRRLAEGLEARPEVVGVTASAPASLGSPIRNPLQAEGADPPPDQQFILPATAVQADYVDVMGMELLAGRAFRDQDAGTGAVIVDLDLARFLWGDEYPVSQRFRLGEAGEWQTVVGVVREHQNFGRDERIRPYQVLVPANAADAPMQRNFPITDIYIRTLGDPAPLLPIVHEALVALDPDLNVMGIGTVDRTLAAAEEQPRFLATLMILFAGVAVALAAVGLFGVLAYTVTLRRRELGIRAALGADRRRLRSMVLKQGLGMAGLGVLFGAGGSFLAARGLERFFYEVEPGDPGTLLVTTTLFMLVAVSASHLPARRATRVDPAQALRAE